MNRRVFITMMLLAVSALTSTAQAVTLQPDEAASKDTFAYQSIDINWSGAPFGIYLPAGATPSGHDTRSMIEFDLSGVGLTGAQVQSATLDLWVDATDGTGFGASPTAGTPVLIDLYALSGPWVESTVTWSTIPAAGALYSSLSIGGINQLVSFDVTALVQDWLDGVLTNNGLLLQGNAPVGSPSVVANFSSASGTLAPALTITPVPEPSTVILALCSLPLIGWQYRRSRARRTA